MRNLSHKDRAEEECDNSEGSPTVSPSEKEEMHGSDDVCEWVEHGNDEEDDRISLGLVGKLWSERILNPTALVKMIGKNLFQFQFYHWRDKEKVIKGQPWHFDKVALLLADMDAALKPADIQFFTLPIWVKMYNILFRGRGNEANARSMGEKIGDVMKVDKSDVLGMEKSLCIRVGLDVRKPLKKHVMIKIRGGEICSCSVKYEKLPLVCFYCGRLGHGTNDCKEVFGERSQVKNFGP